MESKKLLHNTRNSGQQQVQIGCQKAVGNASSSTVVLRVVERDGGVGSAEAGGSTKLGRPGDCEATPRRVAGGTGDPEFKAIRFDLIAWTAPFESRS